MTVKELLKKCQADKTAVLATNFYNFETLTCVMKAAQKMQAPVLLQLTRSSIDYMGLEQAVKMGRQAKRGNSADTAPAAKGHRSS